MNLSLCSYHEFLLKSFSYRELRWIVRKSRSRSRRNEQIPAVKSNFVNANSQGGAKSKTGRDRGRERASIKLGSMLGRSSGCQWLPLTGISSSTPPTRRFSSTITISMPSAFFSAVVVANRALGRFQIRLRASSSWFTLLARSPTQILTSPFDLFALFSIRLAVQIDYALTRR